jgi:hypothetical protein
MPTLTHHTSFSTCPMHTSFLTCHMQQNPVDLIVRSGYYKPETFPKARGPRALQPASCCNAPPGLIPLTLCALLCLVSARPDYSPSTPDLLALPCRGHPREEASIWLGRC